jgi:hypothetical protein
MQNSAWALVLRQFPPEQQNNLMLSVNGIEITIQDILRIDHEHVAFRGRLAGSQDAGRLFIVPYHSIEYFGSQKPCKETDYHELFDKVQFPLPLTVAAAPTVAAPEPVPAPDPSPAPIAEVPGEAVAPSSKTPVPIRSAVLERFRARANPSSSISLPPATE